MAKKVDRPSISFISQGYFQTKQRSPQGKLEYVARFTPDEIIVLHALIIRMDESFVASATTVEIARQWFPRLTPRSGPEKVKRIFQDLMAIGEITYAPKGRQKTSKEKAQVRTTTTQKHEKVGGKLRAANKIFMAGVKRFCDEFTTQNTVVNEHNDAGTEFTTQNTVVGTTQNTVVNDSFTTQNNVVGTTQICVVSKNKDSSKSLRKKKSEKTEPAPTPGVGQAPPRGASPEGQEKSPEPTPRDASRTPHAPQTPRMPVEASSGLDPALDTNDYFQGVAARMIAMAQTGELDAIGLR